MIELSVKRPVTTLILILVFVLLGLVSFTNLNVEQSPRIDFPLISVNVTYFGASPEEIETQIIKPIEDAIVEVSEIKKIKSRAFENFGYVLIEFNLSADVNVKSSEVKDKVEAIVNELPDGIEKPIVERIDPFATPVVNIALTSDKHSPRELYEYADKNLKNQFTKVSGVGAVDLFGGEEREIKVEVDPVQLQARYLSIMDVVSALKSQNINLPAGKIDNKVTTFSVRYEGEFEDVEALRKLTLKNRDGVTFTLGDVALVYDGSKKIETISRFNDKPVVSMSVKKISDGNEINVARGVKDMIPEIEKTLPEGMDLEVSFDGSKKIVSETENTIQSIILGVILTVFILFIFSGNFRLTIIASVVIPSSLISGFLLMDFSGFTINFISLLAMATALGTLIANAIVIIEAVLTQLQMGKDPQTAAIDGTKEVLVPVLASCGTNLVVFTPIAFMGGIVGQFMLQFGMTVVYATLFSLLASFTLTPMMCGLLLKPIKKGEEKQNIIVKTTDRVVGFFLKEYRVLFNLMFKHPILWTLFIIATVIGGFKLAPYVGNEFIPISDEDRIEILLTLPQGSTIWETSEASKDVEALLKDIPEVDSQVVILGENGTENGRIIVNLKPSESRERSDVDLIDQLTPQVAKIPNMEVEFRRGDGGGGAEADISLNIVGKNYDEMVEVSKKVMKEMKASGYFRSLTSSYKNPSSELTFIPDLKKMEQYGVNGSIIGGTIRTAIYGDDTNVFREDGEEYDIRVEMKESYKQTADAFSKINILTNFGLVPITQLGTIKRSAATPNLWRRDRNRIIQINGYLAKSTAGVVQAELEKTFKDMDFGKENSYMFVGNSESQEETGKEIGKAFGLAIILTFMLLCAILNSFVHPFTISSSIITSYAGVFLLLFLGGSSINIASMLGIVMLVGLVVNNAILLIDQTQQIVDNGEKDLKEALWRGVEDKFRAILMTSIAIVAGVLPQLWSPDLAKASMGFVIAGGTLASIVYTFLLTPIVYYALEKTRTFVIRKVVS